MSHKISQNTPSKTSPRILIIRRDNIGDLICTTPLINALRRQLPDAWIAALVNRYNQDVLTGNPDIDKVYAYQKAKHKSTAESLFRIYWQRLCLIKELRSQKFDWVLLPGGPQKSALRFARLVKPMHVLISDTGAALPCLHEVEQSCQLLTKMGLAYETPKTRITPDPAIATRIANRIHARFGTKPKRIIGVHISARKPSQRWPAENFIELIRNFPGNQDSAFMLLWAPGPANDPKHPGDDEKAENIRGQTTPSRIISVPTATLPELIAALSLCDLVICADGGAMHIAAALGKPIVCLFGQSSAKQWRPWGVPYTLLQKESRQVADISVTEATQAMMQLANNASH